MLNRALLSTRYRMIPGLISATLYRKGSDDVVASSGEVGYVEFKSPRSSQTGNEFGASRQEQALIFLWVNELDGWAVQEFDIIHAVSAEQGIDSWWLAGVVSLEMMSTRYRCECVPTLRVDV